jgi:histidinol-phosphate aminotransferase
MRAAIDATTTVVYVCNPNNPTGSHLSGLEIRQFIDSVPDDVLVVVDEAYHEYVTADDYETAVRSASARPNVIVTRTFSKVYGLAALRVGYAVARPETIAELRKAQAPFSVTSVGQVGALASLSARDEIAERVRANAVERSRLEQAFADRGIEYVPSQANFVYLRLGSSTERTAEAFIRHGVILRPFGDGWVRVSVGTDDENDRFLAALDLEHDRLAAI